MQRGPQKTPDGINSRGDKKADTLCSEIEGKWQKSKKVQICINLQVGNRKLNGGMNGGKAML